MNYKLKNRKLIKFSKIIRSKILGINLVGLMISSSLGAFIVAVIIKITITVNNNYQIVKANIELEQSARILNDLFTKFFSANGFGTDTSSKINTFYIDREKHNMNFSMWYAGSLDGITNGINESISCSGRQLDSTSITPQEINISIKNSTANTDIGSVKCLRRSNGLTNSKEMPLINAAQIIDFYVAAIIQNNPNEFKIIPITYAKASEKDSIITYTSFGIKMALILRSSLPVFNYNRPTTFSTIFNMTNFNFTRNDKYLYKLVIIESPFPNRTNLNTGNIIKTQIIKSN